MSTTATVVVIVAAAMVGVSATGTFARLGWVVDNFTTYGIPTSWFPWLATAKALGAIGLLTGLAVPGLGVTASAALVIYFLGAVVVIIRGGVYPHIPFPLVYGGLALTAGILIAGS
ncbi:DoxX family protein [Actinomadura coerulea]|uniref:DoxX family protein n=1 Tax=Actinomadura coerulea TaxID=46159 RepID=UPI0034354029